MPQKPLTILTPTYNRAELLKNLYRSLVEQTCKDFLWLIVDDGSADHTREVVAAFIAEGKLDITYHHQKNGGKYIAHNTGVKLCQTELFVCVDSDDELYPNAVERTLAYWEKYRHDPQVAGIVSPRDIGGRAYFRNPPEKSTLMDLYNKGQLVGDTMLVFRAAILKRFLFPEVENERFMTESVIYYQIDKYYVLATQNEYLYKTKYREDGLTRNIQKIEWDNPKSALIGYKAAAALQNDPLAAAKAYGAYLAWKRIRKLKPYSERFLVKRHVALFGAVLYGHYYLLFRKMKKQFEQAK